jgi:peptide/nickel transport system ATP-binding protein
MTEPLLTVENLTISFPSDAGPGPVVKSVSLNVGREIVAVVGESGSGKSLTGRAIMGLLPRRAEVRASRMIFRISDCRRSMHPAGTACAAAAWD